MHIVASPASRASVLQRLRVSQPRARLRSAVRASSPRNNGERKHESAHGTTARKSSHKDAPVETPVFQPMQEISGVLESEQRALAQEDASLARESFEDAVEAAINNQINIEYNLSYIYHSMACFFNRDDIALPGLAKYFRRSSDDERSHAQKLMDLQASRGGRVHLQAILAPDSDYKGEASGDALKAMLLSLSFEKLNFRKLNALHAVAGAANDFQVMDYVESMLQEQVADIKRTADYVSQLQRVGKGHGTWAWDAELLETEEEREEHHH